MKKYLFLFAAATFLFAACAVETETEQPESTPSPAPSEDIGEVASEAGVCPQRLSCPPLTTGYMNVCSGGSGNDTTEFRCYQPNGSYTTLKPSKTCDDCRPFDSGVNYCNNYVPGPLTFAPWAQCYPG